MKKRTITLLLTLFLLAAPSVMAHDGIMYTERAEPGTTSGLPEGVLHTELTDGIMWTGFTDGIILTWLTNGIISPW
jgi:hypothetical protein